MRLDVEALIDSMPHFTGREDIIASAYANARPKHGEVMTEDNIIRHKSCCQTMHVDNHRKDRRNGT